MDREILFAETLERVKKTAREQGNCISEEQVREAFAGLELGQEQLNLVFDYLEKQRIGVGEPLNPDDYLTEEERDYLQDYLRTVEAIPGCSEGEREAITIAAMAGEADARQRLTEICLRDAADIAKLYAGQGVSMEDLIGEGNVALALGVSMLDRLEKPSEARGMLAKRMMDAMEACIRERAADRKTDQSVADRVNRVADQARKLAEELRRKVTPEELAGESGLSLKAIRDACRMSGYRIEDIEYAGEE